MWWALDLAIVPSFLIIAILAQDLSPLWTIVVEMGEIVEFLCFQFFGPTRWNANVIAIVWAICGQIGPTCITIVRKFLVHCECYVFCGYEVQKELSREATGGVDFILQGQCFSQGGFSSSLCFWPLLSSAK